MGNNKRKLFKLNATEFQKAINNNLSNFICTISSFFFVGQISLLTAKQH